MLATREGVGLSILALGLVACVLLFLPQGEGPNRFSIPKELAFQIAALCAGALVLLGSTSVRVGRIDVVLGIHLALTVLATFLAVNKPLAWRASGLALSMLVTFWTARALARQERRNAIIGVAVLATIVAAMTVLLESFGVLQGLSLQGRAPGGTAGNRNFMAHFLTLGLAPLGVVVLGARQRLTAVLAAGGVACTIMAIVLSLSRAAWLGMAGGIATLTLAALMCRLTPGERIPLSRKVFLASSALLGLLAALYIPNQLAWRSESSFADTLQRLGESERGTGRGRLIQYRSTLELIRQRPIFGVGPGNWSVAYPAVAAPDDPSYKPEDAQPVNRLPNSDWLGIASERGVPALALLWTAAALLAWMGVRSLRQGKSQEERLTAGALLCLLSMVGIMGIFDAVLIRPEPAFLMALCAGALVPAGQAPDTHLPRPLRYGGAIALIIATLGLADRMTREMDANQLIAMSSGGVQSLEAAVQRNPGDYRVRAMLAMAYSRRGSCALAHRHAEAALALYPYHEGVQKALTACPLSD